MNKKLTSMFASLLAILLMMATFSCEKMNPSEPDYGISKVERRDKNISILDFGLPQSNLQKVTTASEWMTVEEGGWLRLFHLGEDTTDFMFVYSHLVVQPNSMSEDAEIGLTVDDQNFAGAVDVEFSPHGIVFSQPALLTMYAYGLDLSGVDVDNLNFYYDNQETGLWEPMEYEQLYVSEEQGIIFILNGELPHFSRYAIGSE